MKVQNTSRYSPITVKGVKLQPKEIRDVPGLSKAEVMHSPLRRKIKIVVGATKKATPRRAPAKPKPKPVEEKEKPPETLLKLDSVDEDKDDEEKQKSEEK